MRPIFVTGIGTNVGKTVVSAVLCEALQADYWKPIQTGIDQDVDWRSVEELITNRRTAFHSSAFELKLPASPNIAASYEQVNIELDQISIPETTNTLIIEGAGGLLVPINDQETYLDFILQNKLDVVVVVSNYLGCINHTLMTFECLKQYEVPVAFAVFNGDFDLDVKETILQFVPGNWVDVSKGETLNKDFVIKEAKHLRYQISEITG